MEGDHIPRDRDRDAHLASLGLAVLRFNSSEVLKQGDAVVEAIYRRLRQQLNAQIPPSPL